MWCATTANVSFQCSMNSSVVIPAPRPTSIWKSTTLVTKGKPCWYIHKWNSKWQWSFLKLVSFIKASSILHAKPMISGIFQIAGSKKPQDWKRNETVSKSPQLCHMKLPEFFSPDVKFSQKFLVLETKDNRATSSTWQTPKNEMFCFQSWTSEHWPRWKDFLPYQCNCRI